MFCDNPSTPLGLAGFRQGGIIIGWWDTPGLGVDLIINPPLHRKLAHSIASLHLCGHSGSAVLLFCFNTYTLTHASLHAYTTDHWHGSLHLFFISFVNKVYVAIASSPLPFLLQPQSRAVTVLWTVIDRKIDRTYSFRRKFKSSAAHNHSNNKNRHH